MGWTASIGVGLITAMLGCVLAGWIANLCADWYQMSSFEGASGYFVVVTALLGFLAGLVLGIVVSRFVGSDVGMGFFRALGTSLAIVAVLSLVTGGTARLLADIPPRLNGEALHLAVEIRWPAGRDPAAAASTGEWTLQLGSAINRTQRASTTGPLWREDARLEDGAWVVPGAVELFTSRGDRILYVRPEGVVDTGWVVPLPGHPGERFLAWSDWLPAARDGVPASPEGFRYRFRVVPRNLAIRTQTWGPFEVDTIAQGFGEVQYGNQPMAMRAFAHFQLRYRGQPVVIEDTGAAADDGGRAGQVNAVAALGGREPALLVLVDESAGEGLCYLVWGEGDEVKSSVVGVSGDGLRASPLTDDTALFYRARDVRPPGGRFDTDYFAVPGQYLLRDAVVDTRNRTVRHVATEDQGLVIERIPPLAVSPDGNSFVRIEWGETDNEAYRLAVTRLDIDTRYRVPVDRLFTRLTDIDLLDPAWVANYFAWQPGPDGADQLMPRPDAVPLPRRGSLSQQGSYREYRIPGALPELRPAVIGFLEAEFDAEAIAHGETDYAWEVRIGEATVSIGYSSNEGHVGIWMSPGQDTSLVAAIAERFNAALQEGRFEPYFAH